MTKKIYSPVRPDVNFPKLEEEVLTFWDKNKIFEKSLTHHEKKTGKAKPYSFYDGPPFATGLPHYGHILAGTLKDVIPRYWTMKGHSVPRRFGWDCHGLPVEYEINKSLNLDSNKKIHEFGVANYNNACRSIVQRYSTEWKQTVRRVGRWVDMENAYFTMDTSFMESVWWVFKQMWDKGLIYEGYKVVPFSTGLSTTLSNFEAGQNYKNVQDPAITVAFEISNSAQAFPAGTSILAWTTTPWTLPSNLALAVHRETDYALVLENSTQKHFIVAEALVATVFKDPAKNLTPIKTFKGEALLGCTYVPLFDFFASLKKEGAFKVIHSDHVSTASGTGVVHMAPAFGEDDYYACKTAGIPIVNPVDDDGMFTAQVPPFAGRRVKDADKDIIADLKKRGLLFKHETIEHSYPFCWRTDQPLIYKAVSSWFVAVEKLKDRLVANNKETEWVPDHLRDGRFGNWLENARDWAISRNRFWGTPLPIWRNEEGEVICIGSASELEQLSGVKVTDLHIDYVDQITIPSPTSKSPLKRISGVLDCWFESGSMPYAQWGYPKTNVTQFKNNFPAEFIAEGLDQTRGWFYTLMVIGTALFDKAPFKNVVVNGLILAEDGKKMSKSLRNYPDPNTVLDAHGADALRLYLIDSPVVKAQELRFSEKGVSDIVRRILLRWWNSYSFFVSYANIDEFRPKGDSHLSPNVLDQWVLSRLNAMILNTEREMAAYRLYNVVPGLLQFVEDLTNTYIRFNRSHFWENGMPESKRFAYETLHHVLLTLSQVMAPFAPFLAETVYQNLAGTGDSASPNADAKTRPNASKEESVHLTLFPNADAKAIRPELEQAVQIMDALVWLGRNYREKISVRAKIPLLSARILHRDQAVLDTLKKFEPYFTEELNVRAFTYENTEDQYIQITVKPNFQLLGKRVGPKMKAIAASLGKLTLPQLLELEAKGSIVVEGETVLSSEVELKRTAKDANPNLATHQLVSVLFDPTVTEEQELEGLAREICRKVQAARKSADFNLDDRIKLEVACSNKMLKAAQAHRQMIQTDTLSVSLTLLDLTQQKTVTGTYTETIDVDGDTLSIGVTKA